MSRPLHKAANIGAPIYQRSATCPVVGGVMCMLRMAQSRGECQLSLSVSASCDLGNPRGLEDMNSIWKAGGKIPKRVKLMASDCITVVL
ncbi:hypothetical protein PoB_005109700 [Plakobranchus ocellatus]|uniref:Uncharacterized protein n=1 Tax=Plakobranchus ocellatus TaxID=259542 RepID=A0AAV4BZR0_9GAST|nr:hypothetical protein PoB_005109700 [Plakobranchus ocellatus]